MRIGERGLRGIDGTIRTALSSLPEADVIVEREEIADHPVDYSAQASLEVDGREAFAGVVVSAELVKEGIALKCRGGVSMTETFMPPTVAQDFPPQDLVYAAASGAGFNEEHMHIDGLDALPHEPFEVAVPLVGIETTKKINLGPVEIGPAAVANEVVNAFSPRPELADEFESGLSVARSFVVASRLWDAERSGLAEIELALAWLAVRANFSFSSLPDGSLNYFERPDMVARPKRLPVVSVRGLDTKRRWMKRAATDERPSRLQIEDGSQLLSPALPENLPLTDLQALLAARRAIESEDLVQRIQAMWEAWEYYAAAERSRHIFDKHDRRRILDAVRNAVSDEQFDRLVEVVNGPLNDTPLMRKLLTALHREGTQLDADEEALLRRLRRIRNQALHGREPDPMERQDGARGCSLLARALTARIHRLTHAEADPSR